MGNGCNKYQPPTSFPGVWRPPNRHRARMAVDLTLTLHKQCQGGGAHVFGRAGKGNAKTSLRRPAALRSVDLDGTGGPVQNVVVLDSVGQVTTVRGYKVTGEGLLIVGVNVQEIIAVDEQLEVAVRARFTIVSQCDGGLGPCGYVLALVHTHRSVAHARVHRYAVQPRKRSS